MQIKVNRSWGTCDGVEYNVELKAQCNSCGENTLVSFDAEMPTHDDPPGKLYNLIVKTTRYCINCVSIDSN